MNQQLKAILDLLQLNDKLTEADKQALLKIIAEADKQWSITDFKLDRTEKIKKTTAILLEETIEELEQKRKAVETQNRELEIESSLERVRTVAMAMRKPHEMLDVCRMISDQLHLLGFKEIRNVQTAIIYKQRHEYINYQYFAPYNENSVEVIDYQLHPDVLEFTEKMLQSADAYYTKTFEGEALQVWREYRKQTNQLPDPKLDQTASAHYYFYSIGSGALGVTTYAPLTEEEINLFKRFRNVFDLAYRRYSDIEKAEAQAREAKIEAALERVRARAMAMQNSDELSDLVAILFDELTKLDLILARCIIWIFDNDTLAARVWMANSEDKKSAESYFIKPLPHPYYEAIIKGWQKRELKWVYDLQGSEKKTIDELLLNETELSKLPDAVKNGIRKSEHTIVSGSFNNFGLIEASGPVALSDEQLEMLSRFAKVFDLTYTRFNDLQQAEAQARESKIEASLERVRSRTMGMQKSEELKDVIQVVYEQFVHLNIYIEHTGFIIDYKARDDMNIWLADKHKVPFRVTIPYFDCAHWNSFNEAKEKGLDFFANHLSFEEKNRFYQDLFKLIPGVPEESLEYYFNCPGLAISTVLLENVGLYIENFSGIPYSNEENKTLMRFGKVFDQAYIRFNDLKQAEEQAREAKIEATLEKVRSRSLAMHRSDELQEVVNTVFERLMELEIEMNSANIAIFKEGTKDLDYWIASPVQNRSASFHLPYFDQTIVKDFFTARENGEDFFTMTYSFEEKNEWFAYAFSHTDFQFLTEDRKQFIFGAEAYTLGIAMSKNTGVQVNRYSVNPFSAGEIEILRRFAKVFEQAYIRFLDLEKAEAQAREAQIEASLERVRAKTMAMHNTQDVGDTVATMFDEFVKLGIQTNRCGILIYSNDPTAEVWTAKSNPDGKANLIIGKLDLTVHALFKGMHKAWKDKESVFSYTMEGDDLRNYYQAINDLKYYPTKFDMAALPSKEYHNDFYFPEGAVFAFTKEPMPEESFRIVKRFAGVFGQTYRRFLDLQKAEAQAREAQIEAGLERVRARTMAMHSSDDVSAATATMFTELEKLGIENLRCGIANIRNDKTMDVWSVNNTTDGKIVKGAGIFDMNNTSFWQHLYLNWDAKKEFSYYYMSGQEKEDYVKTLNATPNYLSEPISVWPDMNIQCYYFAEGTVWTFSLQPHSEEDKQLMKRFTSVFSLTFRRYQDLKQAEAQAKEAQIEAALERVRAKAMAMQNSDDLEMAVATVFEELDKLNLGLLRCGIAILDKEKPRGDIWATIKSERGNTIQISGDEPLDIHPLLKGAYDAWQKQEDFSYVLQDDDLAGYYQVITKTDFQLPVSATYNIEKKDQHQYYFNAVFQDGSLFAFLDTAFTDEAKMVMKRFANVFNLTYKRFLDLQKAEAQARESKIEASLERVRAHAMAMHNSADLSSTVNIFFKELKTLGITPMRCGVGEMNEVTHTSDLVFTTADKQGELYELPGKLKHEGHPVVENIYNYWKLQEEYHPVLKGADINAYYRVIKSQMILPDFPDYTIHYGNYFYFSEGFFFAWAEKEFTEEAMNIFRRFTSVLSLTYKRYKDLKLAEASTREAVKQAALDRVRAEIASMRTVNDLEKITPLIWNELTILGVPFIRCGVFIMDEAQQLIHTFLSTPDGKAIAAFHLPYSTPGNIQHVLHHWQNKKNYIDHWDDASFIEFAATLVQQGVLASSEQYLKTIPKGGFYLHFLPFLQGMLYVGNSTQLGDEEITLIQHVADAFSTAYARYEDFNRLEAAKQQVEKTLADLKLAQTQLVQSEKMASLGELTAGIAHEIQNPLNFVNNFSDVSNELLEEMKAELEKGNTSDAIAIAEDVKQNLEKILHHGKRADGIVKGMLQHSRTGSGQKELTDINVLADEYLRLAFHGLRAKDKSFNAKFETDFDETIGKINIVPQDIGRVILNLVNNAFYAVTEKKKHNGIEYGPTVSINTKKYGDKVKVTVKDNGIGIPQKVLDKIFQPFFSTKPTGQGTGLGLSLSYDIVKAHGGELTVETKDGQGTEFIIQLPS